MMLPVSSPSLPLPSLLIGPVPLPGVTFLKFPSFNSQNPLGIGPNLRAQLRPLASEHQAIGPLSSQDKANKPR